MIPPKEFIRQIHPFSFLSEPDLDIIISALDVELFKKGGTIYRSGQASEYVYVIFEGLVGLFDEEDAVDYLASNEVFGIQSLYGNPLNSTAKAIEDTVCYLIAVPQLKTVFDNNPRFSSFFTTLINRRFRSFKTVASDRKIAEEAAFVLEVDKIIYKKPVQCRPDQTVADAAAEMSRQAVSSIVIVNDGMNPIGILTHKDLGKVIVHGEKTDPVSKFMSSPVRTIPEKSTIFDAFTNMVDAGIDHLVVTKGEKIFGVITRKDIQIHLEPSFSVVKLFRKISKANSIDELKTACDTLRISVAKIAMTGPVFFDLTRMLCTVHDAIIAKVLTLHAPAHLQDHFVWIQMGSSGRKEEILSTDQDNALICREDILSELAKIVNESLASIGFPKCPGNYMASNRQWNRPLSEWKNYFKKWFSDTIPDHIRYLSVFLDMRPVYGQTALYRKLIESVKGEITRDALVLLAQDAIDIAPPLGVFTLLDLHKGLDLKIHGIYPIVNGTRVLAIENGLLEVTNTRERLESLCADKTIGTQMCHDLIESYGFLQDLRLRHQARMILNHSEPDNKVKGHELTKIDAVLLRESLKIVSELQKFLMKKYDIRRTVVYSQL